jgi:hypothetical protein
MRVMTSFVRWVLVAASVGCGSVSGNEKMDAPPGSVDSRVVDTFTPDASQRGTMADPAESCVELRLAAKPTGVYWLKNPGGGAAFEGYCDQDRNGGGWALVYRSVRTAGSTTQFWAISYAQRLGVKGAPMPGANFYAGTLYRSGREYMDTITDLQDKTAIAFVATATGFDTGTMKFTSPALSEGNAEVYGSQFASGWASSDYDNDASPDNCATFYSDVTQHYGQCWQYNLGADAEMPYLDGGVGPHVYNVALTSLSLALESGGVDYSRVNAIERYARW